MAAEFTPQQAPPLPPGPAQASEAGGQTAPGAAAVLSPASNLGAPRTRDDAAAAEAVTTAAVTAATASLSLDDALPTAGSSAATARAVGGAHRAVAGAAATGQMPVGVPPLTYIGVGEAGWGCTGAGQAFRGCKWSARAGIVLRMPDHARLADAAAAAGNAAAPAGQTAAAAGVASVPGQQSQLQAQQQQQQGTTPVCLVRCWGMQLGGQQAALRGVQRCEWGEHGFQLEHAEAGAGGSFVPLFLAFLRFSMQTLGRVGHWQAPYAPSISPPSGRLPGTCNVFTGQVRCPKEGASWHSSGSNSTALRYALKAKHRELRQRALTLCASVPSVVGSRLLPPLPPP